MLQKNVMEEKQLNFDKPLLSVRHFTTGAALISDGKSRTDKSLPNVLQPPHYRSDLKSGPVSNPGTVPFFWEQSPGRPKDETKPQTQTVERPPAAPKLPPGRVAKADQQDTDNTSAKISAKNNQVGNVSYGSLSLPPLDEDIRKCESPEGTKEQEENSSSGDGDEAYLDALDTLSRTESFFIYCSVSGLSGLDDADIKTSRNPAMDPQTRDFMMGRFLPAAKAMALETPQHAPRKPPIVQEHPRQLKKVKNADKQPRLRYGPNFMPDYSHNHDSGEEDSDDDYDEQEVFPSKVCGLLPRLGFRSSFCLLNPVPGMSVRTRAPMSPLSKTQARSSSSGSCSELDYELLQYQSDIGEQRSTRGFQTTKLQVNRNNRKNENYQTFYQNNYKKHEGMSPYRHSDIGGALSNGNGSPKSYKHQAAITIPEEANNSEAPGSEWGKRVLPSFQELLAYEEDSNELDTGSPVVEKTLYVDTVHKVESLNTKFSSSKIHSDIKEKEYEMLRERIKQKPNIESSITGINKLGLVDEGAKSQPDIQKPVEFHVVSASDKMKQDTRTVALKPFSQSQDLNKESTILASLKVPQEEPTQKAPPKADEIENHLELPAPPPLPKSPTDSWLGRTLPSISAKNASMHSYLGTGITPKYQASKLKSSGPKWETMVKTTKAPHQHMNFSEKRLTPIPET